MPGQAGMVKWKGMRLLGCGVWLPMRKHNANYGSLGIRHGPESLGGWEGVSPPVRSLLTQDVM